MTFIDSNIPMYLVGVPHPHKTQAQLILQKLLSEREPLVTDAEALQEILHRYVAIGRREAIQPAFDALVGLADQVFPIEARVVDRAKGIVLSRPNLSARDAIHLAVMEQHGVARILTFDSGFDGFPGISRIS